MHMMSVFLRRQKTLNLNINFVKLSPVLTLDLVLAFFAIWIQIKLLGNKTKFLLNFAVQLSLSDAMYIKRWTTLCAKLKNPHLGVKRNIFLMVRVQ